MSDLYDVSVEVNAELDILTINLRRDLAAIMPKDLMSAKILRLIIINDITSVSALDVEGLAKFADEPMPDIKRRVIQLEDHGWLHHDTISGKVKMADLSAVKGVDHLRDLIFLVNQTKESLEELKGDRLPEKFKEKI